MNHILIITDALTRPLYNPRVRYLCNMLHDMGVKVDLISEKYQDIPFVFPFVFEEIEYYRGGKIDWILKNILNLFFDYKNKYISQKVLELTGNKHYDLVLCSTFHTFGLNAAYKVAKRNRVPLHVDLRDIAEQCADNEYSNSFLKHIPFIGKYYRNVNIKRRNKILRNATSISSVSPWHVEFLKNININTYLIYNGYDEKIFTPCRYPTDKFNIVYAGKWYGEKLQDPTLFFEALQNIINNKQIPISDICVNWYTDDVSHKKLETIATQYKIRELMRFYNYVPNNQVPDILNKSSLILILSNINTRGIMTTKFFEAMGVQKPVICVRSDEGNLENLIHSTNMGSSCRKVQDAEQTLLDVYHQWKNTNTTEVKSLDCEFFSRKVQTHNLIDILNGSSQDCFAFPSKNSR